MKDDVRHILMEIVESDHYRMAGIAAAYRQIANDLNNLMIPQKSWSWQYLHQIGSGKLQASRLLRMAILRLHNQLKIRSRQIPDFESTEVLAPTGFIAAGAIISTTSRKCSSSLCDRDFVPSHPRQQFCSPQCRKRSRRRRNQKK